MFLIVALWLDWSVPAALAGKLTVRNGLRYFSLEYRADKIALSAHLMELSLTRNGCNGKIIDKFNARLEDIFKSAPVNKGLKPENINYTWRGKQYHDLPTSKRGRALASLPYEIHRLKYEELYRCGKNQ